MNRAVISLAATLLFASAGAYAGVTLSGTRLIYHGDSKEASINVKSASADKTPYLIQGFVDNNGQTGEQSSTEKLPFTVTPPLFRLEAGTENTLRVIKTGVGLPEDHESIYWLDVKAIPSNNPEDKGKNIIRFSLKNRIKLIYRPGGIDDPSDEVVQKSFSFEKHGQQIVINNRSPYYITLYSLKVGGSSVNTNKDGMIAPKGTKSFALPAGSAGDITWQYINDYGAASKVMTAGKG